MSWFDAKIEWTPETERFRELLERIGREVQNSGDTMRALSDEVFTAIASEAIDDAQDMALSEATQARRERAWRPKTKRRKKRRKRKSGKMRKTELFRGKFLGDNGFTGLKAALTTTTDFDQGDIRRRHGLGRRSHQSTRSFGGGTPVALRETLRDSAGGGTVPRCRTPRPTSSGRRPST